MFLSALRSFRNAEAPAARKGPPSKGPKAPKVPIPEGTRLPRRHNDAKMRQFGIVKGKPRPTPEKMTRLYAEFLPFELPETITRMTLQWSKQGKGATGLRQFKVRG